MAEQGVWVDGVLLNERMDFGSDFDSDFEKQLLGAKGEGEVAEALQGRSCDQIRSAVCHWRFENQLEVHIFSAIISELIRNREDDSESMALAAGLFFRMQDAGYESETFSAEVFQSLHFCERLCDCYLYFGDLFLMDQTDPGAAFYYLKMGFEFLSARANDFLEKLSESDRPEFFKKHFSSQLTFLLSVLLLETKEGSEFLQAYQAKESDKADLARPFILAQLSS